MSKITDVFVGIDYHDRFSTVCVIDAKERMLCLENCGSTAQYIDEFVRWKVGNRPVRLHGAIEACGGASKLADDLRQLGWKINLAHALTVSRLSKNLDKTDKQDARLLADLVRAGYVPYVYLAPERQRQLRSLVRYREQLANNRRQIKQRIRGLMRESHLRIACTAWTGEWLQTLRKKIGSLGEHRSWVCERQLEELEHVEKQIRAAEQRLKPAVAEAPGSERLLRQAGIGLVTAAMLLAEIGDFSRFRNGKQLSRYCGLAPVNCSSGQRDRQTGIGKACNGDMRRLLIEASHRLSRYSPRWKAMKAKLVDQGKKKSVATVAVANRWLRRLHYIMTHEEELIM